jgi:hypothetical protein
MCVDCVHASPRIAQVDPGNRPLPVVVLSHLQEVVDGKDSNNFLGNNELNRSKTHEIDQSG